LRPVQQEGIDWHEWMRALGRQERRVREFLGLSQEQLARLAGVSQGAVSRLEAGRGLATPMLVVMKINLALRRSLGDVDPELLNDDLRRMMRMEEQVSPAVGEVRVDAPVTKDPGLAEIVRHWRKVAERQRDVFLSVVRAAAQALASASSDKNEQKS